MTYKRKPTELPIADIRVGRRHRKDMGDIAELAASMAELGLLQAIGVRPNNELIWDERRLRAAQQLGWTTIPVKVMDLDAVARGEFTENAQRKNFTLSEAVAIKRALETLEKAAAKARMLAGKPSGRSVPWLPLRAGRRGCRRGHRSNRGGGPIQV
jgi:ParB/RepB/Spo0J family partition protein